MSLEWWNVRQPGTVAGRQTIEGKNLPPHFFEGVGNLGGPPLGQLAARVEMGAIDSGNSDHTTIKIPFGNPDSALCTTIKMA